jgi:hypothetical protein
LCYTSDRYHTNTTLCSYGLYDIETSDDIRQILEEERGITKERFDKVKVKADEHFKTIVDLL